MQLDNDPALFSNQEGQYISLNPVPLGGDLSFSWWGHFDKFFKHTRIFDFGDNANDDNLILFNDGWTQHIITTMWVGNVEVGAATDPSVTALDTDVHLVVTVSSTLLVLYVNGAQVQSDTMSAPLPTFQRVYHWLGKSLWQNLDHFFDGWMQAFSVYKRELSANDVTDLYNKGINNPCYVLDGRPVNIMCVILR